jgi:hypothetical protein
MYFVNHGHSCTHGHGPNQAKEEITKGHVHALVTVGPCVEGVSGHIGVENWTQSATLWLSQIDEYATAQICYDCYNKLIPLTGEPHEKYCTHCGCDVDRDINAAKNILEVFLFHVRGWGRPDYLCRPNQHQVEVVQAPQTAEV